MVTQNVSIVTYAWVRWPHTFSPTRYEIVWDDLCLSIQPVGLTDYIKGDYNWSAGSIGVVGIGTIHTFSGNMFLASN